MKSFIVIFGLVAVLAAQGTKQQDRSKLAAEKLAKVKKVSDACAAEHNVDPAIIPKVADGTIPRGETYNKYLHCFATKNGIVDEVGHIVVDKMVALLGDHPRAEEFKETLKKCNDVTKENSVETVVAMHECYAKTSPVLIVVE